MSDHGEEKHEILIIRRHGGDHDDGHHGGAWKIAYADFVTAMMAFFLVMWLINSANEATRARVASYFNPIKMTDASPSGKGLKDSTSTKRSEAKDSKSESTNKAGAEAGTGAGKTAEHNVATAPADEEAMMGNPFQVLDKISSEGTGNPSGRTVDVTSQTTGDPFDPMAWEALKKGKVDNKLASASGEQQASDGGKAKDELNEDSNQAFKATGDANQQTSAAKNAGEAAAPAESVVPGKDQKLVDQASAEAAEVLKQEKAFAEQAKKQLSAEVEKLKGTVDIKVDVKTTDEGVLIVLGDGSQRTMFDVGSAKPNPGLVEVVGTIGQLLESQNGQVVVRGHTDGRRFRNIRYDNWQLSTARAHMASYMLMRGGLPETRIARIEGYGAANLAVPDDPLADANRRVEFLLTVPKGP